MAQKSEKCKRKKRFVRLLLDNRPDYADALPQRGSRIQNSHRTALDLEVTPSAKPNMLIYEIINPPYLVV